MKALVWTKATTVASVHSSIEEEEEVVGTWRRGGGKAPYNVGRCAYALMYTACQKERIDGNEPPDLRTSIG